MTSPMSVESLLTSPAGLGLTTASPLQRAVCRIIDGRPLGELADDADVVRAVGGADAVAALPPVPPREVVILAGIRTAKSMTAAAVAIARTQTCDLSGLAPGEVPRVACVSLTTDLADVVFRHVVGTIQARPALRRLLVGEPTADAVLLRHPSGRAVEIKVSALAKAGASLVARWLLAVVFDEAPRMVGADDGVRNLADARASAVGRLRDGGQILTIGSPWAPFGPVYDLVQEHAGKPSERLVVIRGTGPTLNPSWWTPARCAALAASDPTAYQTDVLGEFADPETSLFPADVLAKVTRESPAELRRSPSFRYVAAIDPATRGNSFTLTIVEVRDPLATPRYSVALVRQWTGSRLEPLDLERTIADVASTCSRYGVTTAHSDQFSADALVALAKRHGLTIRSEAVTAASKLDMFESLRTRIATGELQLSPDPVLRADLLAVAKRVTQSGIAIVLPRTGDGRHADYAPALALAVKHAPRAAANAAVRSRVQITGATYDETPIGWDGPPSADGTIPEPAIAQALANALGLGRN